MSAMRLMIVLGAIFFAPALTFGQQNNFQQGLQALANRDYDLAISCFSQEVRQNPREAAAFANRGNAYAGKGEYGLALEAFTFGFQMGAQHGAFIFAKVRRTIANKDHRIGPGAGP